MELWGGIVRDGNVREPNIADAMQLLGNVKNVWVLNTKLTIHDSPDEISSVSCFEVSLANYLLTDFFPNKTIL